MSLFQTSLEKVAEKMGMPELLDAIAESSPMDENGSNHVLQSSKADQQSLQHCCEVNLDADLGPGSIPASFVSIRSEDVDSQTRATAPPDDLPNDIVTRGKISLESAQRYFDIYAKKLDHFVYGILAPGSELATIRVSPLLTSAICAVGSLHANSPEFEVCYQEFINLSASKTFSKKNTIDEVRALVIGAFWLKEISWISIGSGKPYSCAE